MWGLGIASVVALAASSGKTGFGQCPMPRLADASNGERRREQWRRELLDVRVDVANRSPPPRPALVEQTDTGSGSPRAAAATVGRTGEHVDEDRGQIVTRGGPSSTGTNPCGARRDPESRTHTGCERNHATSRQTSAQRALGVDFVTRRHSQNRTSGIGAVHLNRGRGRHEG